VSGRTPGPITVSDLGFTYPGGIKALLGVSFRVEPGERAGLIGPNGSGKSTLLLCLLGLLPGASGAIEVDDMAVNDGNIQELRRRCGLVFQDPEDQLFNPTVLEDAAFGPMNLGLGREEALRRAEKALSDVGIDQRLFNRPPHRLSAGQKRRAAIAGVLAMDPAVILLDEPTSDLDPRGRKNLAVLLNKLPQTMIIASHDLEFVLQTCGSVIVMDNGKVEAGGEPREIMSDREFMERHGLEKPHSLVPHAERHHR